MKWTKKHGFKKIARIGRHTFYAPEDLRKLNGNRAIMFWSAVREFSLRITHNDLDVFTKRMKSAVDEASLSDAGYLVNVLDAYRQLEASERTLLNVGQHFIFVDGEKNKELQPKYEQLKQRLFENNVDVRAFFLLTTWNLMKNLLSLSTDIEIVDYLSEMEVEEIEKAFSTLIAGSGT